MDTNTFFPGKIGLAPMAGITDCSFRKICFESGAQFAFTEMISAKSILLNIEINNHYFPKEEERNRVGIQLFGSDPAELAEAAAIVQEKGLWVDLNAGCPVNKVVKKGAGSGLLRDLSKFRRIVRAMRNVLKHFTVKTRLGWENDDFEKIYNILVEERVDAIFVHGRTAKQMYSGKAKWKIYNPQLVPLYISGDLYTKIDVHNAIEESGAKGAIIARGSIGNPWIFSDVENPSYEERMKVIKRHLNYLYDEYKNYGAVVFRKFVAGYTKNLPGAREFREKAVRIKSIDELTREFEEFFDILAGKGVVHRDISR
ncbi:MAG: tRNA dihydrouridine synthase [Fervidobacterium sp.]|jgi:nifR3 family TIM-barrel protein